MSINGESAEDTTITDIADLLGDVSVEEEGIKTPEPEPVKPVKAKGTRASTKGGKTRKPVPAYRQGQFIEPMADLYQMMGMMMFPFNQPIAETVIGQATACGEAWDEMAKRNDSVRRMLLRMQEGGAWGALFMAHAPIAVAVMANSRPGMMGPIIDRMSPEDDS